MSRLLRTAAHAHVASSVIGRNQRRQASVGPAGSGRGPPPGRRARSRAPPAPAASDIDASSRGSSSSASSATPASSPRPSSRPRRRRLRLSRADGRPRTGARCRPPPHPVFPPIERSGHPPPPPPPPSLSSSRRACTFRCVASSSSQAVSVSMVPPSIDGCRCSVARHIDACQYRLGSIMSTPTLLPLTVTQAAACCAPLTREPLDAAQADDLARSLKAIADPARLRLVSLIAASEGQEACVCDLTDLLDVGQPTVSPPPQGAHRGRLPHPVEARHLGLLRARARLARRRRATSRHRMIRRLAAEFLGSALLAALVVGSGIAAQRLSPTEPGSSSRERVRDRARTARAHPHLRLGQRRALQPGRDPRRCGARSPLRGATSSATSPPRSPDASAAPCSPTDVRGVDLVLHHRARHPEHLLAEVVATAGLVLVIFALARRASWPR